MTFFTSDPHYWHTNVIRYCSRPFAEAGEMNEAMIEGWNSVVEDGDKVYCLGDFSLAFRAIETYSFRLKGERYLVPGNHDFCHSYHKKSRSKENREKWIQKYKDYGWTVLPEQDTLALSDIGVVNMCHHPYATDFELKNGDKYADWRPVDDGTVLLCGHVHEKWATNKSPNGTLMINVGVDVRGFKPISEIEILGIINAGK